MIIDQHASRLRPPVSLFVALLSALLFTGCGGGCAGGGGGASKLIDKLPAAANGVVLVDLDSFLSTELRQQVKDVASEQGADVSKIPDWAMKLKAFAVIGNWTAVKGAEPSVAMVLTGDFDAAVVAKELEALIGKEVKVEPLGKDAVAIGKGMMFGATTAAWSGKGDAMEKNAELYALLGKVDRGATFVMAGQGVKALGDAPFVDDVALSYDLSDGLAIKAWAKGEAAMFKKAEEALPMLKMGAAMLDKDRLAPMMSQMPGIDPAQLDALVEGVKEFIDSVKLTVSDDTIAVSGSTSFDVKAFLPTAIAGMGSAFSTYMKRAQQAPTLDKTDKL